MMRDFGIVIETAVSSPSIVRISISIRRAMNEIGTSLAPPSNGFDEFSPTFSSETKTQPTTALNGTFSQTVQCSIPADFPSSCAYGNRPNGTIATKIVTRNTAIE